MNQHGHRAARWWVVFCVVLGMAAAGCGAKREARPAPADPRWSQQIEAHTAGMVSRRSPITVRFARPVAGAEPIGKPVSGLLEIEPAVAGQARFTRPEELVFTPERPLAPGQEYRVRLQAKALPGLPPDLPPYEFRFRVLAPDFEVKPGALEAAGDGSSGMKLSGSIETADGEDPVQVKKLLAVSFSGQKLPLEWAHFNDNRSHFFTATGISRREQVGTVHLAWDGAPIGVKTVGQRDLEVPPLGLFTVTDVSVLKDERQAIRITFSDPLQPEQNLKGLVRLGKGGLTTRVDGNSLLVYPADPMLGEVKVTVDAGVRNHKGKRLGEEHQATVFFVSEKPQVRFTGSGVILPENPTLGIPFEAINVNSVQVTAFEVYPGSMGQFLQVNKLDGTNELHRVGRFLWRKTLRLSEVTPDRWTRYTLDASELLRAHPGALFRLTLSVNRSNSVYACTAADRAVPPAPEPPLENHEDLKVREASSWDYAEEYFNEDAQTPNWQDRDDPCKDAYYQWAPGVKAERNFLASDLGLIAKRGSGGVLDVITTSLRDASPLPAVRIEVRNFQDQVIGEGETDPSGFARVDPKGTPFYLVARSVTQVGYLKLSRGAALPTSHFDVGGETVSGGIKGFLYGERGVWRPGDEIHLGFILEDKDNRIPADHPVTVQLFNPKGQLVQVQTQTAPVGDFYTFTLRTPEDAPTGNWTAKALLGGAEFSKPLKIETVMPNRLKLELALHQETLRKAQMPVTAKLSAQWLHGASAAGLKADVAVKLNPVPTRFSRYTDFSFDDPTREFKAERQTVFEDKLDAKGEARVPLNLAPDSEAPGQLEAVFTARVFEPSGAFSTSQSSAVFHPYEHYIGLKTPKGDAVRGMLLTDVDHALEIASLDPEGKPADTSVHISFYKIQWKWWWEQGPDNAAQFNQNSEQHLLREDTVKTVNGQARWTFQLKYPEWGRYMIRACDTDGGHCAVRIFYMDWPGWAGRAQEESGPGANALQFFADKPEYTVGETAHLQLPEATQGRALLTLETGTRLLEKRWISLEGKQPRIELPITAAMSPNVYVGVTLIQPHQNRNNDRPIRLYGFIPIKVRDPSTVLTPQIRANAVWRPSTRVSVEVTEAQQRAMTYTLAVVDEGLLGLTQYRTPNPRDHFYKREALGVQTWDLYDEVTGAYGSSLERLLALGGDTGGPLAERQTEQKRFPPVVRYYGPFRIKAGETGRHAVDLPQYLGAVRVMVVAGENGAYGSAEKSVIVREPVTVLPTLPRVLGPDEELRVPVSVFTFEPEIREVQLSASAGGGLKLSGESMLKLAFDKPGERMDYFTVKVDRRIGKARFTVRAQSGRYHAESTVNLDVRAQNPLTLSQLKRDLEPDETWKVELRPHGVENTNRVTLEVAGVPPFDLEKRLAYLIHYPHGCVEQLTSAAFPQLYLDSLMNLRPEQRKEIERNVNAALERLRGYQQGDGMFGYWPGNATVNAWANNYAGHFVVEARRLGYAVPPDLFETWVSSQRNAATAWSPGDATANENQAYRLYTLALADRPDVSAMNRLKETRPLSALARWQLAAAYAQIGLGEAADDLMRGADEVADYAAPGATFGSALRDRAILLNTLVLRKDSRRTEALAKQIAADLSAPDWHSTQSVAYGLLAMSRYATARGGRGAFSFEYALGKKALAPVQVGDKALHTQALEVGTAGTTLTLRNTSKRSLHASVLLQGSAPPGQEQAANEDVQLTVQYLDAKGHTLDVGRLAQGGDFVARITVTNRSGVTLNDLALTQIVASGWEIHNPRLDSEMLGKSADAEYQDIRDDRVLTYFGLKNGESRSFNTLLNASYLGRYYLPAVSVESMYDARHHAHTAGQWVEVVKP